MGTICKGTAKVRLFFESASGSAKKSLKNCFQMNFQQFLKDEMPR